jgi:hypothetical protein
VLSSAKRFQKVEIKPKDVLLPFFILMTLNLIVLITWTMVDPLVAKRIYEPDARDEFGRKTDSFAVCTSESNRNEKIFYSIWFLNNFCAVAMANYESYKGKDHPSEFNESKSVAISMGLLLEAMVLALPVLATLSEWPSAFYLVKAVFVSICACALSFPLFVQKYRTRNMKKVKAEKTRMVRNIMEGDNEQELPTCMENEVRVVNGVLQAAVGSVVAVGHEVMTQPGQVDWQVTNTSAPSASAGAAAQAQVSLKLHTSSAAGTTRMKEAGSAGVENDVILLTTEKCYQEPKKLKRGVLSIERRVKEEFFQYENNVDEQS